MELPHAIDHQGIAQIHKLLTHGSIDTSSGSLITVSLEQTQLEVGLGHPIFDLDFPLYGFLTTDCWIKSLWSFVPAHHISLCNADQVLPHHQREGNAFIMELLVVSNRFSQTELIRINQYRLALRAMTLVDITTGDSSNLTREAIQFLVHDRPLSKWDWPNEHPGHSDITLWHIALHSISSETYSLPLLDRLGKWIAEPHLQVWWFYSPDSRQLFYCHDTHWDQFDPISARATRSFHRMAILFAQAVEANDLQYASAHGEGKRLQFDGSVACAIPSSLTPHNMASFLSQDATNWPLFNSFFPPNPTLIVQALISGMGTLVSDGSYKEFVSQELGTASWIFECRLTGASCRGVCQTSGLEHEMNAYQSELQGIHAGLIGMLALCSFHGMGTLVSDVNVWILVGLALGSVKCQTSLMRSMHIAWSYRAFILVYWACWPFAHFMVFWRGLLGGL